MGTKSAKAKWSRLAAVAFVGAGLVRPAFVRGQSAVRTLPDYYLQGTASSISIALSTPQGTAVVGIEDKPPAGWSASNISNGGAWDAQSQKVKWGPFFGSSIPTELSYQATPPGGFSGEACFVGSASFDGLDQPIGGEACIPIGIPALSGLGAIVFAGLTLAAGVVVLRRRRAMNQSAS
jgi:hypothetical protein